MEAFTRLRRSRRAAAIGVAVLMVGTIGGFAADAATPPPAHNNGTAGLKQVGPIDETNGFPLWYKDPNNVRLELCLVPSDANGTWDVFVRDVAAGTTTRVSANITGSDGDLASSDAMISGDGHRVVFSSSATNLIAGDTNGLSDEFVRDLAAGVTVRANVSTTGGEANAYSNSPSLSRDGRFVSFVSDATNLVSPAQSGHRVYVRDTQAPTTTRPTSTTTIWARLSGDGRYLAEQTSNGVVLVDRFAGASINLSGLRTWAWPVMSSNGRYIVVVETKGQSVVLTVAPNPFGP